MTTAQWAFTVALSVIAVIVVWFTIFVARSVTWGDRWYRRRG